VWAITSASAASATASMASLAVLGWVLHERGFEQEQRLHVGELGDLLGQEVGDGVEEGSVVTVVFVGREVGQRVGAGQHCLQPGIDLLARGVEFGGHVAGRGEVAGDDRLPVEVVVVVVPDDPARVDGVGDRERVGDHVVPPPLALDDAVETGRLLVVEVLAANAVVGVLDSPALRSVDQVGLLVALQIR
jgi:hypothetical protein